MSEMKKTTERATSISIDGVVADAVHALTFVLYALAIALVGLPIVCGYRTYTLHAEHACKAVTP